MRLQDRLSSSNTGVISVSGSRVFLSPGAPVTEMPADLPKAMPLSGAVGAGGEWMSLPLQVQRGPLRV